MKLEHVEAADDPRLADYRDVRDPRWLREDAIFLAEGRRAVGALLAAPGFRTRSLLVSPASLAALGNELAAAPEETPVYRAPNAVIERVSGVRFHQGVVAVGERTRCPTLDELLAAPGGRLLVLERISDPDNVGGLFRSARAFACSGVLLSPGCASPLYRKAIRTSMAASLALPFLTPDDWPGALDTLRQAGWRLLGLSPEPGAEDLTTLDTTARVALVLGNEGAGLGAEVRERLDARVRIPMAPGVDSLNVASAGSIALQRLFSAGSR